MAGVRRRPELGRCYISGPITGHDLQRVKERFAAAAEVLAQRGYVPVNPLDNGVPVHAPWEEHMAADITTLMRCRAIYMLGDWQESHGARLEHAIAKRSDLHIIYENGEKDD